LLNNKNNKSAGGFMLRGKYAPEGSRGKERTVECKDRFFSPPETENVGPYRERLRAFHQNAADELRAIFAEELNVRNNELVQSIESEAPSARVAKL
jgi:hypothetical protein